jgi:hypothetical protein
MMENLHKQMPWLLESLGGRVALTCRFGGLPPGRSGTLVSIQSGKGLREDGVPYATVAFNLADPSDEESVPLRMIRPVDKRG